MNRHLPYICLLACALPTAAAAAGMVSITGAPAFLALGFAVGLTHALDADHVAAVAAMMNRRDGRGGIIARGTAWGVGHTIALFLICSAVLLFGITISGRVESALELAVGVMIMFLGLRVLWKLHRERIHIHVHAHDGMRHAHAHSHAGDPDRHEQAFHDHRHPARALLPTLGVGLVHGAAGSAGLLVLIVAGAPSTAQAMLAVVLFGLGSLTGMTLLTAIASRPLRYIHRGAAWMRHSFAIAVGFLAMLVGGGVALASLAEFGI